MTRQGKAGTSENSARRVGRPARVSLEMIAEAALEIGLDKVTMIAIAQQLGVDHSSLYRHVGNRQQLLFAAADRAISTLEWRNDAVDWRDYLRFIALAVWRMYQRHPGLAEVLRGLDETPPAGIRAFAETVAKLQGFGFQIGDAVLVLDSIMDMTVDSVAGWRRMAGKGRKGASVRDTLLQSWVTEASQNDRFGRQIEEMTTVMSADPEHWWLRKLGLLLDGAETLLAP